MIDDADLRAGLAREWGFRGAQVIQHAGGMNSATWRVSVGERRWVAKAVAPAAEPPFRAGLAVARRVQHAGVPAGPPVPTSDGRLVASVGGCPVALLEWVPGTPLTGADAGEQRLLGATLALVHRALRAATVEGVETFHWVDPAASHLGVRPWIRREVSTAVAALDALGPLTAGLLHTDPAPEAFRWDGERDTCGLIDWSVAMRGPLLYDVASAVMYLGGPDRAAVFLDAYRERAVCPPAEIGRGLIVMLRFRWAVQADYFARRITVGDLTGIAGSEENEIGLADARRGLRRTTKA